MDPTDSGAKAETPQAAGAVRLDGWKDIATYAKRGVRTVQRWEQKGFPVHRHEAFGTVYAYESEIDAWLSSFKDESAAEIQPDTDLVLSEASAAIVSPPKRRYSWMVAACAVGLVITLAAIWLMRARMGSNRPVSRSFAVLEFRNLSGKAEATWLSTALAELFRSELESGGKLRPVSGEDVARMTRDLALPKQDSFSKTTLRNISKNLSADFVVIGSYVASGRDSNAPLRVQVRVQNTRTAETVVADVETGTEATLFDVVDRAGRVLREKLRAAESSNAEMIIVRAALPRSLESQRLYAEGLSKLRLLDAQSAAGALTRAVQTEPRYALAHSALAEAWGALGYEAKATDEAKLAYEFSAALSPEEALIIEAKYRELTKSWPTAIAIYRKLCEFAPRSIDYSLRLAHAQALAGDANAASVTLSRTRNEARDAKDPRIDLAEALIAEAVSDFKGEQTAAMRAETQAHAHETRSILAQALLRRCWAAYKLGQPKQAIDNAQKARQLFVAMHDRAGEAQALKNLADVIDDQGDHAQGRKVYEAALAIFREIGYQAAVAVTLNNLAYAVKDQGDLAGARKLFEESLRVSREISDQAREALALNGLGIVFWRQGDLAKAREMFEAALAIHEQRGDKNRSATLLNNVALVFEDEGKLDEAITRFDESTRILRKIGNQDGVARNLGNLGDLLLKQGKLQEAKARFEEQIKLGQTMPEPKQAAYGLHGLGNVLLTEGEFKGARAKHEEALAVRKKLNEKGLVAESQLALAQVARQEGKLSEAVDELRQAANEFQAENEMGLATQAYAAMSLVLIAQGNFSEAQRTLDKAAQLSQNTTDYAIKLDLMLTRGRLHAAFAKGAGAERDLESGRNEAARRGYVAYEFDARLALAEIAVRTKKPGSKETLQAIEKEANNKGFGLIARNAGLLLDEK